MSPISGYLTPEARATLDAVFAKLAAPGMCNPDDIEPCVSGTPSQAAIQGDTRSAGQRNHDALLAAARALPGLRRPRTAQRLTGLHHRHHHTARTRSRRRQSADRRRHPAADVGCDPAGLPRPPLPGHLQPRQSTGALSHQTPGLTSPANCVVRQGPWLHVPRLHRARLSVRSPPLQPLRHQPRHRYQRPDLWLRPQPQTRRTRLDHPQKRATATPNGSHHHTSTTANPAPTPTTTPKNSYETTTKTSRKQRAIRAVFASKAPRLAVVGDQCHSWSWLSIHFFRPWPPPRY